jgi:bifunctional non-homologous end joining protein LigD
MQLMKPVNGHNPEMWQWNWYVERKEDGQAGRIEFDSQGKARMFRTGTEITDNWPGLVVYPMRLSVFQVEWCAGRMSTCSEVTRMVASGGLANVVDPRAVVLDLLEHKGQDWRPVPFAERRPVRRVLTAELDGYTVNYPLRFLLPLEAPRSYPLNKEVVNKWLANGYEGAVLKDPQSVYTSGRSGAWLKVKPFRSADCWVTRYSPGGGKFTGMAGALVLEMVGSDGNPVVVGSCSGMTDEVRQALTDRLDAGESFAVEVAYQTWTKGGRLRHAQYRQLRPDKALVDCVMSEQMERRAQV